MRDGSVFVANQPHNAVSFATLAAGKTSGRQMTGQAAPKGPDAFTLIGTDVPRVDVPAKVTGTMKFGYDTTVPGMLHGEISGLDGDRWSIRSGHRAGTGIRGRDLDRRSRAGEHRCE